MTSKLTIKEKEEHNIEVQILDLKQGDWFVTRHGVIGIITRGSQCVRLTCGTDWDKATACMTNTGNLCSLDSRRYVHKIDVDVTFIKREK